MQRGTNRLLERRRVFRAKALVRPQHLPVASDQRAGGHAAHSELLRQLALGRGFAWLEGAVMAGVKLVPFGQQAAQTLLRDLGAELPAVLDQALTLGDDELGGGLPLLAIASSRHETQYTRLFRS